MAQVVFLLAILPAASATAACQNGACQVEDEVSLLQTKLEVPDPMHKVREEWQEFKADMDDAMSSAEEQKVDNLDAGDSTESLAESLGAKMARMHGEECDAVLGNENKQFCFISGGKNPEKKGDTDHYTSKEWTETMKGPGGGYKFCGVAGIYKNEAEGTIMVTKGATSSTDKDVLKGWCEARGKKLSQDSVLFRAGGKTELIQTYPTDKVGHVMMTLPATPSKATIYDDFKSALSRGGSSWSFS